MKASTANLKIFYQRPILYLWYLIIFAQLPALLIAMKDTDKTQGQSNAMFHIVMSMLFGLIVGSLQKEIMSRPVTFCLPGHKTLSHKLIFELGALFTLIPVAVLFNGIKASTDNYLLVAAALWSAGMAAYLLSIWLSFQEGYSQNRPCLVGGLWAILFIGIFFGGKTWLWLVTSREPLIILLPSLIWIGFFWVYLGKEKHRRSFCGQNIIGMFGKWDMRKVTAQRTAQAAERVKHMAKISAFVEQFITAKMKSCLGWKKKATFGFIYTAFDRMLVITSLSGMLVLVLLLLAFGYALGNIAPNGSNVPVMPMLDIFFILPVFGAMMHMFPAHSTLHIPGSRKDKFHASIATAIFVVIFAMVFVGVFVGLANIIEPYMPEIPGHIFNPSDQSVSFSAPSLSHIYIIPMLMPLGFAASVLFGNKRSKMVIAGPVVYGCSWAYIMSQTFLDIRFVVPAIFVVSWLGFIAVLQRRCMKGNLV
jgi:hypothetical protein